LNVFLLVTEDTAQRESKDSKSGMCKKKARLSYQAASKSLKNVIGGSSLLKDTLPGDEEAPRFLSAQTLILRTKNTMGRTNAGKYTHSN
jgi:hypothetical protein